MTTMGALHWVYLPEILNDTQFGLIATCHYLNGIEVSVVTEFMLNAWMPQGMYLFYGVVTCLGTAFFVSFVKET